MCTFKASLVRRICGRVSVVRARRFGVSTDSTEDESWKLLTEKRTPSIKLATSLKERKYREKHERILLEGWRLIKDALLARAEPVNIFFTERKLLEKLPVTIKKRFAVPVHSNIMQRLSSTVTPPGIVGVFKRPNQGNSGLSSKDLHCKKQRLPLTVVCDGVKDPSNLGTLIRVCAAAGCTSLITTKGSMDVWDQKVLRCAAGGHFHLPIFYSLPWEVVVNHIKQNTRIFMADSNIESPVNVSKAHYEVDWTLSPSALLIGGETTGLSIEARRLIDERSAQFIRIPMVDGVDSLSAAIAASVIIYEAYRQTNHGRIKF